ncbi:MAG: CheY-like chemotaxis protein [Roseivirga sp.]|jgi:CheY-like chemotaxis protein
MIKILIAEDDFGVRDTLKDFLEFFYNDIEIAQAVNGQQAIDMVKEHQYDILISDQMMPDMTGIEFIQSSIEKLRADGTCVYVYSGQLLEELTVKLEGLNEVKIIDKFTNPMFFKEIIDSYKAAKS